MKRLVIITVGKTHSGKTTFAKELEQKMLNSLVVDQDNHAEFINTYYKALLPKQGPNKIKYAITQTNSHLILCNSNRSSKGRINLLNQFKNKGFITILVNFDIPDHILQSRVDNSQRSKIIFRSASTFEEVLNRQQAESQKVDVTAPLESEADHFFVIKNEDDVHTVSQSILTISQKI